MTENKNAAWLFDVWMAATIGYGTGLYFNHIWSIWAAMLSTVLNFFIAIVMSLLYSYVKRHWKP